MPYQNVNDLPQDVRDKLPEDAQHIYVAAFNSIAENSGDEEFAKRVAWNTIETDKNYEQSADGKWHHVEQPTATSPNALGNMHQA